VTQGIISALNRPNPYNDDARKPGQFIQTDAAINPGNSGGPLVDAKGEVIGINTFLISPSGAFSGAGFAIPSTIARPVVEELIRDGKVEHAYIGVGITDITPQNAKFFHRDKDSGAVITEVQPDSPAAKAGLKVGDVITKIDGQDVSDAGHLQVLIGAKRPGTEVRLEIARDGNQKVVPVTLAVMGKNAGSSATENASEGKGRWGLGISDLTPDVRQELQAPSDLQGAVIERVVPGSPADNAGLSRGEVIQQVDRKDVKTATDLKDALASVPKGQDVLLLVWANGGSTFVVMHAPTGNSNS
jgi:serine protease Do